MATAPTPNAELTSISHTLHLFHHRNHNQHRLAKWYKSFSQLRRHISKLILELETLDTAIIYSGEESKYVKAAREKVEDRVEFMRTWLEERWYVNFSNLVADNQYAAMGLFLLGTLARARTLIGPLGRERVGVGDEEVEVGKKVVEEEGGGKEERYDFGEVVRRDDLRELSEDVDVDGRGDSEVKSTKKRKSLVTGEEDVEVRIPTKRVKKDKLAGIERIRGEDDGEIGVDLKPTKVKREDLVEDGESTLALKPSRVKRKELGRDSPADRTPSNGPTKTKKKKKREKGDAFDDLFDSLI